jgi:serine/threonine-protein kinase
LSDPSERLRRAIGERYRIERELGRGGTGIVFLASDLRQGRPVAIKLLRPDLGSLIGPERFLREIDISGKLNHPHILPIFDAGNADGLPYYVMPFIEGESLRDRLRQEEQLSVTEAIQIAKEVADGLAYAHGQGVIHRDIKPENILFSQGHAVLADFGIARITAAGPKLTETGMAIGTVDYMSPEQATGSTQIDGRSDLYSLACVLYEMLAGAPPFVAPTAQAVLARHLVDPVPPIRTVRPTVPVLVEAAILCALAKSKADRFTSVQQFVEALEGRRASPSQPYPAAQRSARWKPFAIAGGVVLAIALTWFLAQRQRGETSVAGGGPPRVLDSNLIAVAPFDILDVGRESWREGLAQILSVNLDGAGALRTVPLDAVVRGWSGRADRASAERLGRAHGAGLVVFGRGVSAGKDSVRLNLTLLDVTNGQIGPEIEVRDLGSRLDLIADSATARILDNLNQVRAVAMVRSGGLGSTSWPAKKAYLRGEEFYRRHSWDSSEVYYRQAITLDGGFALAWHRLGAARLKHVPEQDSLSGSYMLRAGALNRGLSTRDSLLVNADSLYAVGQAEWGRYLPRLHAILEELTRRYPDDAEAWSQRARARVYAPLFGMTLDSTLFIIQQAVARDSGYAELLDWEATVGIALRLDSLAVADHYLRGAIRRAPREVGEGLQFAADLLADPSRLHELSRWIERSPDGALRTAIQVLRQWPDSGEIAIRLATALGNRRIEPPNPDEARERLGALKLALWQRGHLMELARMGIIREVHRDFLFLFGVYPPDSVPPAVRSLAGLATNRDVITIGDRVDRADAAVRRGTGPATHRAWEAARARAYLALARQDTSEAIRRFIPVIDSLCYGCSYSTTYEDIYTAAPLLMARGRYREVSRWLDYYPITIDLPEVDVFFALWRGRVAEHLGQLPKAASAYRYLARAWVHADSILQPYVSEAVAGLRRVGGGAVW